MSTMDVFYKIVFPACSVVLLSISIIVYSSALKETKKANALNNKARKLEKIQKRNTYLSKMISNYVNKIYALRWEIEKTQVQILKDKLDITFNQSAHILMIKNYWYSTVLTSDILLKEENKANTIVKRVKYTKGKPKEAEEEFIRIINEITLLIDFTLDNSKNKVTKPTLTHDLISITSHKAVLLMQKLSFIEQPTKTI